MEKRKDMFSENALGQEKQNSWEQILKAASINKTVQTKNLIIMGDGNSGKSVAIAQLIKWTQTPGVGNGLELNDAAGNINKQVKAEENNEENDLQILMAAGKNELGLTYISSDIHDEEYEGENFFSFE
ncbi:hypothetical protein AX774_g178 [Zancudomyces culisetae]|uniref:Uncharacterized protein n=1 Tax=Zancudomyces culisetae TaxID=1213189 RepID=A0A1R1PZB4_ZANCU|nr:hypothetical protein AX774_g178 [Zancudomyces culisetae]|eukprot:OMH86286.1 hypothetical protein AX774_g178 [Zancudomyces culisetae]